MLQIELMLLDLSNKRQLVDDGLVNEKDTFAACIWGHTCMGKFRLLDTPDQDPCMFNPEDEDYLDCLDWDNAHKLSLCFVPSNALDRRGYDRDTLPIQHSIQWDGWQALSVVVCRDVEGEPQYEAWQKFKKSKHTAKSKDKSRRKKKVARRT